MATKSFTLKIGADTSDFIKGLKSADRAINSTVRESKTLQKGLKLEFDETRFTRAQALAQDALQKTNDKMTAIKGQLQYLEENGGAGSDGYIKLQNELAKTENKAVLLKKQLEEIDKIKLENLTKGLDNVSAGLTKAGNATKGLSLAAAGAAAGMVKLASDAVATGDDLQTTADQFNTSAEAIQRWNYIALQTDVPAEQLFKAVAKVRDAIGTGLAGETSTGADALRALNLSIEELGNSDDAFYKVATALSEVEDTTLRAFYANELFGERVATELIPLLNQSSGALAELSSEFEDIGFLSNEQVAELASFDQELNKLKTSFSLVKTEIGIAFLPILQSLANFLENSILPVIQRFTEWFASMPEFMQNASFAVLILVASLSPLLLIGGKILGLVSSMIKALPFLSSAIQKLGLSAGQALFAFAALGTAIGLIFNTIGNWKQLSAVQVLLRGFAVAALAAATAMIAFQASWSLGLAIAGIVAAIGVGAAAIKAIQNDFSLTSSGSSSSTATSASNATPSYAIDTGAGTVSNTNTTDNSTVTNNITINANGADAQEVYDLVAKNLTLKVQSRS